MRIEIAEMRFTPASVAVSPGDTVTWINRDIVPHTTVSGSGRWDSGQMASGATFTMVVDSSGIGSYRCAFHPGMTGVLVVR